MKESNKKLTQNTFFLYIRTLLTMFISLFTSRVVLQVLGIENYGIYNLVGGVVAMFAIVSGCLTGTTQRYLTYELGKGEKGQPQKIFSVAMVIHIAIVIILLLLFETIGFWFLNHKLNIETNRIFASNCVYQCSIFVFLINIICIPYNSLIIAHEKMKAFAYISLFDAIAKLFVVYLLYISPIDKLITYSILLLIIACSDRIIYSIYCKKKFPETQFVFVKDKDLYKNILAFSGYNFISSTASILCHQGVSIILNLFFGVVVNAARGIAGQVQYSISKFVTDFMVALNPQITKEYAVGNKNNSLMLCYKGARFSYFLMLFFSLPIIFQAHNILKIWLGVFPDNAVEFVRLTLVYTLCTLLSTPLITEILAIGRLKYNTIMIGAIRLLTLPLIYCFFKLDFPPYYAYIVLILIEIISLFVRLIIISHEMSINAVWGFTKNVLLPITYTSFISFVFTACGLFFLKDNLIDVIVFCVFSCIITGLIILTIGLSHDERTFLVRYLVKKVNRR